MTDPTIIFNTYFVSVMCLFYPTIKALLGIGFYAFIMRGFARLLLN